MAPGVAHAAEDFALHPDVLPALWHMEERHFWHAARNRWIARALAEHELAPPAPILEVGCGSGAVACYLHRLGYRVTGLDTAEVLLRKAHQRCPQATFLAGDGLDVPADLWGRFLGLGFFDVLEHLSAPEDLLAGSLRAAAPGALVLATVPALGELHGPIDDLSGHKRRYEPGELGALLARCGLERVSEHGVFRAIVPLMRLWRRRAARAAPDTDGRELMLANLRVPSPPLNAAMGALCALERALGLGRARNRAGASLLAVGWVPGA